MKPSQESTHSSRRGLVASLVSILTVTMLLGSTLFGVVFLRRLGRYDPEAVFYFLPTLLVLGGLLFVEIRRRPYSLNLLHLLALYILLGAAPLYQVAIGRFPLALFSKALPSDAIRTNLLVLLWTVAYAIGYFLFSASSGRTQARIMRSFSRSVSSRRVGYALILCFPLFVYLVALGLGGVVTRAAASHTLESQESPIYLLNSVFVRAFPFVAVGAALVFLRKRGFLRHPVLLGLLILVIPGVIYADNPLAAARYWTVAVVMGWVVPLILSRFRTAWALVALLVVGLAIMPGLGQARHAESASELVKDLEKAQTPSPVVYLATNGDVGAYGILNLTFRWLKTHDHTFGTQSLGTLLFFVPRSLWHSKPISTGARVTGDLGFDFTILSAPILAEPLIDFGWIGVPIYALMFGALLGVLDRTYWGAPGSDVLRRIDIVYPFLLGMVLFMTRGSLMSAFAFTCGFLAATIPLWLELPGRRPIRSPRSEMVAVPDSSYGTQGSRSTYRRQ